MLEDYWRYFDMTPEERDREPQVLCQTAMRQWLAQWGVVRRTFDVYLPTGEFHESDLIAGIEIAGDLMEREARRSFPCPLGLSVFPSRFFAPLINEIALPVRFFLLL